MNLSDVEKTQFPGRDVPEHAVYLEFSNDDDAMFFRDWLWTRRRGWDDYLKYREEELDG